MGVASVARSAAGKSKEGGKGEMGGGGGDGGKMGEIKEIGRSIGEGLKTIGEQKLHRSLYNKPD